MSPVLTIILLTALAGLAMPAGALLARFERIRPSWLEHELRHTVIAFGGGALLAAVALVLVPDGINALAWPWASASFLIGGLAFFALDRALAASKTSAAQLVAMLSDFVPEAMALGATFAAGEPSGALLALLIGLQNLPEGFNAYRELRASTSFTARRIILSFLAMAALGPVAGLVGYEVLAGNPAIVAAIMLFAAGGILYLTFEDIAPQAKLRNRHAPALGAVCGFLFGMMGQMLIVGD